VRKSSTAGRVWARNEAFRGSLVSCDPDGTCASPAEILRVIAMKTIATVVSAAVLALALMPASAAPVHHKRYTKAATAAQPQIACTVVGCIPVPRGCHPEMGYTPGGTPTGFDVAVCPNYTLYGNRR
jgi:hypothetical protein